MIEHVVTLKFLHSITENDLDGKIPISALEHGPEALKEAIPSLGKRLKLNRVLKTIQQDQQVIYV